MRITPLRLALLLSLTVAARATPILYTLTGVDGFTLGRVSYPYSGRTSNPSLPPTYRFDLWILTDTSSFVPYFDTATPPQELYDRTTDVTAVVGYNGTPLATFTGPLRLQVPGPGIYGELLYSLDNTALGATILTYTGGDMVGVGRTPVPTSAGEFVDVASGPEGSLRTTLDGTLPLPATATPEPSTCLLVLTGVLGSSAVLRRRRILRR